MSGDTWMEQLNRSGESNRRADADDISFFPLMAHRIRLSGRLFLDAGQFFSPTTRWSFGLEGEPWITFRHSWTLKNKRLLGGVAVVLVFMLVARPVTVFLCALPDRRAKGSPKESVFMGRTRETGLIPGAPAGLPVGMGATEAKLIASVTFIAIAMTILIPATKTRWLGRKLGLLEEA
jgi:hypothetical protein